MAKLLAQPAKFAEPHGLDTTRRPSGRLGLGTGLYAGAVLVRSAAGPRMDPAAPVTWTSDTLIQWPRVISAKLP
jgi:hypothetical protein